MNRAPPSRAVSDAGQDDIVLPFLRRAARHARPRRPPRARHRFILKRHAYPAPIARIVGEAVALTVLLGSALKIEGSFQLQTKTDGALGMLIVDFDAPSNLRALARFDANKVAQLGGAGRSADLLGSGHLAFTIDSGAELSRYQGVIALDGQGLEEAAHQYFQRSEQIPTFVRLAVGEVLTPTARIGAPAGCSRSSFRLARTPTPGRSRPRRCAAGRRARRRCRRRPMDGGEGAGADDRGSRTDRPDAFKRAVALSSVSRTRRAGFRAGRAARRLSLFDRAHRCDAA